MIKLLGGNEVSEEAVKYLVDDVNSSKENFNSINGVEVTTNSIVESLDGLSSVWDTLGGANKISKAKGTVASIDTSRLKSLFQLQVATKVSYSKEPVLLNTIYHQGGENK